MHCPTCQPDGPPAQPKMKHLMVVPVTGDRLFWCDGCGTTVYKLAQSQDAFAHINSTRFVPECSKHLEKKEEPEARAEPQ